MAGLILLYNLIALVAAASSAAVVLVFHLKTRERSLLGYLVPAGLASLIVAALSADSAWELAGRQSAAREALWSAINYLGSALVAALPRMGRRSPPSRASLAAERAFAALGAASAAAALAIQAAPANINLVVAANVLIYSSLALALAHSSLGPLVRASTGPSRPRRRMDLAIDRARILVLALLPALVAVDFFGWLLPWGQSLPRGLTVMPAIVMAMSVGTLLAAARDLLEPPGSLSPAAFDPEAASRFGMTAREAEVAALALQCLTYREIGERLFISPGTVRTHLVHVYGRTGARNRLELARLLGAEPAPPVAALRPGPEGAARRVKSTLR